MGTYIKDFETHSAYNTYITGQDAVLPNVSYCEDMDEVHYNPAPPTINGHEYVDLGLPSGTKWATMNVGASSITDYGNYYKFGLGTETYDMEGTPYYNGSEDPLPSSLDTATQSWGTPWHMPTYEQCQELIANTTYEWVTDYQGSGINGGTFTANGQTLFIPAAGRYDTGDLYFENVTTNVWSSSNPNDTGDAYTLGAYSGGGNIGSSWRAYGQSIRPVAD